MARTYPRRPTGSTGDDARAAWRRPAGADRRGTLLLRPGPLPAPRSRRGATCGGRARDGGRPRCRALLPADARPRAVPREAGRLLLARGARLPCRRRRRDRGARAGRARRADRGARALRPCSAPVGRPGRARRGSGGGDERGVVRPRPRLGELGAVRGALVVAALGAALWVPVALLDASYLSAFAATNLRRLGVESPHTAPIHYYVLWLPALLLPWTLFAPGPLARAARDPGRRALVVWAAFVPAVLTLARGKLATYALPALAPLALVVGADLASGPRAEDRATLRAGGALVAAALTLGAGGALFAARGYLALTARALV